MLAMLIVKGVPFLEKIVSKHVAKQPMFVQLMRSHYDLIFQKIE